MARTMLPAGQQKKHLTIEELQRRKAEEELIRVDGKLPKTPPKELVDGVAKREWKRARAIIAESGSDGFVDRNNLIGYCNSWSLYMRATEELVNSGYQFAGSDGKANPITNLQIKYAAEVRNFANLCGLSLDSRLKIGATKFKKQEDTLEETFGAI